MLSDSLKIGVESIGQTFFAYNKVCNVRLKSCYFN